MARKRARYERVRATRCRHAYRWVRAAGYLIMFSGFGMVAYDSMNRGSTPEQWSTLRSIGFLSTIIAFIVFASSYVLYISIRTIEAKLVRETRPPKKDETSTDSTHDKEPS